MVFRALSWIPGKQANGSNQIAKDTVQEPLLGFFELKPVVHSLDEQDYASTPT